MTARLDMPVERFAGWTVAGLLAVSVVFLALAPKVMPASYSWIAHTTSESAAQGLSGAWVARTGFLCFGAAVLVLVGTHRWTGAGRWLHATFGVCMVAAAAYSSRPWMPGPHDPTEDMLHSVAATAMGFAFAIGVVAVMWQRVQAGGRVRAVDAVAVVASVAVPVAMVVWPSTAGLLQRAMFAVAYLWYGMAALDPVAG